MDPSYRSSGIRLNASTHLDAEDLPSGLDCVHRPSVSYIPRHGLISVGYKHSALIASTKYA